MECEEMAYDSQRGTPNILCYNEEKYVKEAHVESLVNTGVDKKIKEITVMIKKFIKSQNEENREIQESIKLIIDNVLHIKKKQVHEIVAKIVRNSEKI
jgi:hypothetical protein